MQKSLLILKFIGKEEIGLFRGKDTDALEDDRVPLWLSC